MTPPPHLLLSAPFRFLERCRYTIPTLEPSHSPSPLFWMPFSQIANSLLPSRSPTLTTLFNIQPPTPSRHIPLATFHGAPFHLPCIHPLLHTETFTFYHLSHTTRTQIQEDKNFILFIDVTKCLEYYMTHNRCLIFVEWKNEFMNYISSKHGAPPKPVLSMLWFLFYVCFELLCSIRFLNFS